MVADFHQLRNVINSISSREYLLMDDTMRLWAVERLLLPNRRSPRLYSQQLLYTDTSFPGAPRFPMTVNDTSGYSRRFRRGSIKATRAE